MSRLAQFYGRNNTRGTRRRAYRPRPLLTVRTTILGKFSAGLIAIASMFVVTTTAIAQNSLPPVSAARGVALFDAICGKSLPNFRKAERSAKANSVSDKAQTGTIYSTKENFSFRISEGPGNGKTCSVVFKSKSSDSEFKRAASNILTEKKVVQTSIGNGGLYNGTALVLVSDPIRSDGETYYSLKMLSQR